MKFGGAILAIFFILATASPVFAHPGRTDSSGCHTCRTNCPSWGLSYGEYHCHNAKAAPQPEPPIHSRYGEGGTGYTEPAPEYEYKGSSVKSQPAPVNVASPQKEKSTDDTNTNKSGAVLGATDTNGSGGGWGTFGTLAVLGVGGWWAVRYRLRSRKNVA
mgnify:CR=1 FL=1